MANENESALELSKNVENALKQPQSRFAVHDAATDTTFRFPNAQGATNKADEISASSIEHMQANNRKLQVTQKEGEWTRSDGKSLNDIQKDIDKTNSDAIRVRADLLLKGAQGVDTDTLKGMALADVTAFRRIQDPFDKEDAATEIAANARLHPDYKTALDNSRTASPGVAESIYATAASFQERQERKDDRKQADQVSMRLEREAAAKAWTPEEAVQKARLDLVELQAARSESDRLYARADITMRASVNVAYAAEVKQAATKPELAQLGMQVEAGNVASPPVTIDASTLARLAASRANDSESARQAIGLNAIEPSYEKQIQPLPASEDAKRDAWVRKAEPVEVSKPVAASPASANQVESDEVFTARTADVKPVVPAEVEKQYLRVGDKFYNSKNTELVAFEDKGNKLETRSNSEQIAISMVRIAEARGWDEIKLTGSESFRREAWLEAASRGMHVKGYEASEQDKAELLKRTGQAQANKIEPENRPAPTNSKQADAGSDKQVEEPQFRARETTSTPVAVAVATTASAAPTKDQTATPDSPEKRMAQVFAKESAEAAVKKHPELAGAVAAVAAIDKKAEADGFTVDQREVIAKRVRQNITNAIERGDLPKVTIREEVQERRATKEQEREQGR